MKKTLLFLIVLYVLLALVSCVGETDENTKSTENTYSSETSENTEVSESSETLSEEPYKISESDLQYYFTGDERFDGDWTLNGKWDDVEEDYNNGEKTRIGFKLYDVEDWLEGKVRLKLITEAMPVFMR